MPSPDPLIPHAMYCQRRCLTPSVRVLFFVMIWMECIPAVGQANLSAEFNFSNEADQACIRSPVKIQNTSQGAITYLWDFCPESFRESPVMTPGATVPGLLNGWGYKVVNDNGNWTGFLVSRNTNVLYRLEFGNNPTANPVITNMGNPGNLLVSPQGLDIVNQNGNWYAFIGKGETTSGQIVRLDFGRSLINDPAALGLGTFGISGRRMRDVKIVKQREDWIVAVILDTENALLRINYRDSFDNPLSAEHVSSTGALPGANLTIGFSLVQYEGNWILHTASFSNHEIQQYNFGSEILGSPAFEGSFAFTSVTRPYYIKVIQEGGSFFGFVGNETKNISIIKFGNFTNDPEELPNSTLPRHIGFDVAKYQSKNIVQGALTGSTSFVQTVFENTSCPSDKTWSDVGTPLPLSYHSEGSHSVELMVTGSDSQYDVTEAKVLIKALHAPEVEIEAENVCLSSPVHFSAVSSKTIQTFEWNFGDDVLSTEPSPMHSYAAAGEFTVGLDVIDSENCSNTISHPVAVYDPPSATFLLPGPLLCTNNAFTFSTTTPDIYDGNLSYQWLVDNNPVSTDRNLNYTFTTTGPKDITLVTAIPGCSDQITQTTSSVEAGPVVDFSFDGICEDDIFAFRNEITDPVEAYLWDFGNSVTSDQPDASHTFPGYGEHPVSLTATNSIGCENVVTKVISVHSKPTADFSAEGPPNACTGTLTQFKNQTTNPDTRSITDWLWSFGDPNRTDPETAREATHIFETAGTYPVSLTATTADGCSGIAEKEVVIHAAPSTAFTRTASCLNVPTLFTGPSDPAITTYYWEIGTSYYLTESPTHTFKSSGGHPLFLEVTGSNGCVATHSESVAVPVPLNPDFSVLKNCVGHEALFTDITSGADAVASRTWSVNGALPTAGSPLAYTFNAEGNNDITLTVLSEAGCTYEKSKTVTILPPPVASFSATPQTGAYPLEVDFTNTSTLATHYLWEFRDGSGSTTTAASPSYTFLPEGSFEVRLTAYNAQECASLFAQSVTTVAPLPDVHIETITLVPNPDGSNKLVVTLHNRGNTFLRDLALDLDVSGKLVLRGILDEAIAPGAQHNFVFNSGIVNADMLRYLCASVTLQDDVDPVGNRMCAEFEDQLFVFPAYPNPATTVLTLEWISERIRPARVSLLDAMGRQIRSHETTTSSGLNRLSLNLEGVSNGLYFLVVEDEGAQIIQRIVVSGKP